MEAEPAGMDLLEFQELDSANEEGFRVESYTELLALYLREGDLCNAKFLWKRIPASQKSNAELTAVWNVGQMLWIRDMPAFYNAVRAFQWSATIAPIMTQLIDVTREKMMNLVGTAYTSVQINDVANLLGLTASAAETLALGRGWTLSEGFLTPTESPPSDMQLHSAEEQLGKLTDYVTFLEN